MGNNDIDSELIDRLVRMKIETPEKYIEYMKVWGEVMDDYMASLFKIMKKMKEEM